MARASAKPIGPGKSGVQTEPFATSVVMLLLSSRARGRCPVALLRLATQ
jgi:hypothetical protein